VPSRPSAAAGPAKGRSGVGLGGKESMIMIRSYRRARGCWERLKKMVEQVGERELL
jgi:hypothetical protein